MISGAHHPGRRRGIAIMAVIVLMLVVSMIIVGMVITGGRDQDLSVRRFETVQSFYAAEGGTNMAIREMMIGVDEDADGAIGTISDDANAANDPTIGVARVAVTRSVSGMEVTLAGPGRHGVAERKLESLLD